MAEARYVGAIDQGTTSTRFMVFDHDGAEVGRHQLEHEQILPQAGWVEHDATEIWERTQDVIRDGLRRRGHRGRRPRRDRHHQPARDHRRLGPPHRRAVPPRDRLAGHPHRRHRQAARARRPRRPDPLAHRPAAGLVLLRRQAALDPRERRRRPGRRRGRRTRSSARWTPGCSGTSPALHLTDVTNASRTMLMDLETLDWDDELLDLFGVPRAMLPEIRVQLGGLRHDRRRRAVRRRGPGRRRPRRPARRPRRPGLLRAGQPQEHLRHRQLPGAQHRHGDRAVRARTASPRSATASATSRPCTRWRARSPSPARPSSGCATSSASSTTRPRSKPLAAQVDDTGGMAFVPAFSGLFAPYWRSDARGAIVGLSRFNTKAHLARAALEAICHQSADVVEAMVADADLTLDRAQGRRRRHRQRRCACRSRPTSSASPVSRPVVAETTALGAAYAAGLAVGFWSGTDELVANWAEDAALGAGIGRRAAREPPGPSGPRRSSAPSTGSRMSDAARLA